MNQQKLIDLYAELSALTNLLCAHCPTPYRCCEQAGCDNARNWADLVYNVKLQETNGRLPYLTETGCTVAAHHRMLCTLWLCGDAQARAPVRYNELKAEIIAMEASRWR